MRGAFYAVIITLLFAAPSFALFSGSYNDYVYQTDYTPPQKPENAPLSCNFFYGEGTQCEILDLLSNESKESVTLGIIKRVYPDENQDWVRFWNTRLPISDYYDNATIGGLNISDGDFHSNDSLQNTWIRLINIYPSAFNEAGGFYYVPNQALALGASNVDFVVPNSNDANLCGQEYDIKGYDASQKSSIGSFATAGQVVPFSSVLEEGQLRNLTYSLEVNATYMRKLWMWQNSTQCYGSNCTITRKCELNLSNFTVDKAHLNITVPVKRYSNSFSYLNRLAVPQRGFAAGVVDLQLPKDFLFYQMTVKGQTFVLRKNDLKIVKRGEVYPVLQVNMISAPSKSGTLHITSLIEEETDTTYRATIRYKLYLDTPNLSDSDCRFYMMTPFSTRDIGNACETARSIANIELKIANSSDTQSTLAANVTDQFSNPIEGITVEFSGLGEPVSKNTDASGIAQVTIEKRESTQTIIGKIVDSVEYSDASDAIFMPGKGATEQGKSPTLDLLTQMLPIFLIILIVSFLVMVLMRRRSLGPWMLISMLLILGLGSGIFAQGIESIDGLDVQATLDACRNYDFDNAVRHLGECSESYRIATEFSAMRRTAGVLVENIAPLVVANPDITPYKTAYSNMVLIALSLFRVAWAFNSLYLILNIFNPTKRSQALRQYVWLIVFVIFTFASFSIVQDSISAINSVSVWIAGTAAADNLSQATLSTEFVVENYEMLKLVLPFLNVSYLILLARYITVIGMLLFFPFTLLLYFTSATRGFGKAALTVTFAALGLGVLNAILLLIYNILMQTQDAALAGSFASTFFSASFIIFFGFVNLIVLCVSFLSGIMFIGGENKV